MLFNADEARSDGSPPTPDAGTPSAMPGRQHFAPDEPQSSPEAASAEHAAEPPLPQQEIGSHAVAPEDSDSDGSHAEQHAANGMPAA